MVGAKILAVLQTRSVSEIAAARILACPPLEFT